MPPDFLRHFSAGLAILSLAFLTGAIGYYRGLFTCQRQPTPVSDQATSYLYLTTLLAFASFVLLEVLVIPTVVWLTVCQTDPVCLASPQQKGWINCLNIAIVATFIIALSRTRSYQLRHIIWGTFSRRHLLIGAAAWLVGYPATVASSQLAAAVVSLFSSLPSIEQLPVQELRQVQAYPGLLMATVVCLVTLVPITEEILFRGLLQTSLRCLFNRQWAIVFSAAIFTLFHYAPVQGVSNFEILSALFVFACLLGFLYERQGSLWAPIALHATFNAISIAIVLS